MGLFTRSPIWMTEDKKKERKAIEAVGQINDPFELKKVFLQAPLEEVRYAALRRIDHAEILKDIVIDASASMETKRIAVSRISDQNILKEIVLNKKKVRSYDLRWTITPELTSAEPVNKALDLIKDPDAIKDIVFSGILDDDPLTMVRIIDRLPDDETIERAAREFLDEGKGDHLKIIIAAWKRTAALKRNRLPEELLKLGQEPDSHFIAVCSRCGETVEYFETWSRNPLGIHGKGICNCQQPFGEVEGPRYMHYHNNGFEGSAYSEQFWEIQTTKEPISDDEIAICPICSGLRFGTCEALKNYPCTCEYKDLIKPLSMKKHRISKPKP